MYKRKEYGMIQGQKVCPNRYTPSESVLRFYGVSHGLSLYNTSIASAWETL